MLITFKSITSDKELGYLLKYDIVDGTGRAKMKTVIAIPFEASDTEDVDLDDFIENTKAIAIEEYKKRSGV